MPGLKIYLALTGKHLPVFIILTVSYGTLSAVDYYGLWCRFNDLATIQASMLGPLLGMDSTLYRIKSGFRHGVLWEGAYPLSSLLNWGSRIKGLAGERLFGRPGENRDSE